MRSPDAHLVQQLTAEGVTLSVMQQGQALPLKSWSREMPSTASTLMQLPHNPNATELTLTSAQIAELAEFSAVALELPRLAEAWLCVRVEGRIDSTNFRVTHTLEPLQYAHPWAVYERVGAVLLVGGRKLRLNPWQLRLFEALDRMYAAGNDIAARLAAWPELSNALQAQARQSLVRIDGALPRLQLQTVATFPPNARVRREGRLRAPAGERWAMAPKHRYYLLAS